MISWGTSPQHGVPLDAGVPAFEALDGDDRPRRLRPRPRLYGRGAGAAAARRPADRCGLHRLLHQQPHLRPAPRRRDAERAARSAPGVRAICVPGSTQVKPPPRPKGSTASSAMPASNGARRAARCASSRAARASARSSAWSARTNRNFESRQGPGTRTHLASPETVAASAIAGHIADPRALRSELAG